METPKKRKRDAIEVFPPRITYDAATRTFDRLFKEDSLEAMKTVVRKKLGVSHSTAVYLSQLREGKSVDLEDDDDFEAFRVAAQASSEAKVKVVLGNSAPAQSVQAGPSQPISSRERKEKKKKTVAAGSSSASPDTVEPSSKDATIVEFPLRKKPKVAFQEPPSDSQAEGSTPKSDKQKKSKKKKADDPPAEPQNPPEPTTIPSQTDAEPVPAAGTIETPSAKRNRRKKKGKQDKNTESEIGDAAVTPQKPKSSSAKGKEKETESGPASVAAALEKVIAASADDEGSAPTEKKPGKRRRSEASTSEPAPSTSSASKSPPQDEQDDQEAPRPAKKSKKGSDAIISSATVDEPAVNGKSAKTKDCTVESSAVASAMQPSKEETGSKKKKEKKEKTQAEPPSIPLPTSEPEPSEVGPDDPTAAGKTKKSLKQKTKGHSPEESATGSAPAENATESPLPQAKTPGKKRRKSVVDKEIVPDTSTAKVDDPQDNKLEAARAAIQAMLARKALSTSLNSSTPTTAKQAAAPAATPSVTHPEPEAEEAELTTSTAPIAKEKPELPPSCPICLAWPTHARAKCPTIKSGIKAMRKRIAELEKDDSDENLDDEEKTKIIAELQGLIEKKTKKPKALVNGTTAHESKAPPEKSARAAEKQVDVVVSPRVVVDLVSPVQPAPSQSSASTSVQPNPPARHPTPSHPPSSPKKGPRASQKASQKKTRETSSPAESLTMPNPDNLHFMEFGDVNLFTEKDLDELVHGPKITLDDVPSSTEEEEEEEVIKPDEEEDADADDEPNWRKQLKRHQRVVTGRDYPSSSDEDDDEDGDDDDNERPLLKSNSPPLILSAKTLEPERMSRQPSEGDDNLPTNGGDLSFHDLDDRGSSRELDRTGNDAVNDALMEDLAPFHIPEPPPSIKKNDGEADSDVSTAVASMGEEGTEASAPIADKAHSRPGSAAPEVEAEAEETATDPIESSVDVPRSRLQPEPIASDDEAPPVQSTPKPKVKAEVVLRPRSQRNKTPAGDVEPVPAPPATGKGARKTKSLTKISEMAPPINPSARIIRPAPTPLIRTRRAAAQEESQNNGRKEEEEEEEEEEENEVATKVPPGRTRRTAPAKPPAKNSRALTKPPWKAAGTPVKPPSKSTETPSKVARANAPASPTTSKTKAIKITPTDPEEPPDTTSEPGADKLSVGWAVLQETPTHANESQGMFDELQSSPDPDLDPFTPRNRDGPLFLHSETQQDFPYSQYDIRPPSPTPAETQELSPHDSEDEDEVAASVVKPLKPAWRPLSQIASQTSFEPPKFYSTRLSQTKQSEVDLYGRGNRKESEESDDSDSASDSEAEKALASHIPASRRAGASSSKRK